jgi:hypothetical protein
LSVATDLIFLTDFAMFELPANGSTFVETIIDRCTDLIESGFWNDLKLANLKRWLRNFQTDSERYFAACLLDRLIYRSHDQTVSLARHLFQRVLPDLARSDPSPICPVEDWLELLRMNPNQGDPLVRVVPAVPLQRAGKSGDVLARLLRRELRFCENWIIDPGAVPAALQSGAQVIIFVDDFVGTGDRFQTTVGPQLQSIMARAYTVFAALMAHQEGLEHLRQVYSKLRIAAVEELDSSHKIFSPESEAFSDGVNDNESAKAFYYEFLAKMGIPSEDRLGTGNLELAVSFEHATPKGTLPIFWWPQLPQWSPLFEA